MRKITSLLLLAVPLLMGAKLPQVTNVTARQDGKEIVIEYDLDAPAEGGLKFKYIRNFKPDRYPEYDSRGGTEISVVALDGKPLSTAGHHRVGYRVLDDRKVKIWRSKATAIAVGVCNTNSLESKFFPIEGIKIGDRSDGYKIEDAYGSKVAKVLYLPKSGLFYTGEHELIKNIFYEFRTTTPPSHWQAMGFSPKISLDNLIKTLKDIGFTICRVSRYSDWFHIYAACKDLDLTIIESGDSRDMMQPGEWHYNCKRNNSSKIWDFCLSAPGNYEVFENPAFADFVTAELKTGDDGFPYYLISKDGKHYGVADEKMNVIIAPDTYHHISFKKGLFSCEVYSPELKQTCYTVIDTSGKKLLSDNKGKIKTLGSGVPFVVYKDKKGDKAALFSRDGRQLTEFNYTFPDKCLSEEEKLIAFTTNDKNLGFMDYEGNVVLSTKFYNLRQNFHNGYAVATLDKGNTDPVLFDRFGVQHQPTNLMNDRKKWNVSIASRDLPTGVVAIYQTLERKVKKGKKEEWEKIDENHFLYNVATHATWMMRPLDSGKSCFDSENAFNHTFRRSGDYIICYARKKEKDYVELSSNRIMAVFNSALKPLIPYSANYYSYATKIMGERYLTVEGWIGRDMDNKIRATYDLFTGNKINNELFRMVGDEALLVPVASGNYKLCNYRFEPLVPFEVSDASVGMRLYSIHVPELVLFIDKDGEHHYWPEHASEPMRSTLQPDTVKNYKEIYLTPDGEIFGSKSDASALRNRIADYLAPSPAHRALDRIDSKLMSRARQGDGEANYTVFLLTSVPTYLERAVESGYLPAIAHHGFLLLNTADSVKGREMLAHIAKEGYEPSRALEAIEKNAAGQYAEAYEGFKALGSYMDARHEAGMAALSMAYRQYQTEGKKSDYAEWVDRAADCDIALAENWAATIAKERGDGRRCAELYAKTAERNNVEAAYMAAVEFEGLNDYPSSVKYMEMAATAKFADADARLGNLYLEGKPGIDADKTKAFKWLHQAHMRKNETVDPALRRIALPLATEALGARKYGEAARYARTYIAIDSLNPEAYELLGLATYGHGDYASALNAFRNQLKLQPKNADCIDNIERASAKYNAEVAARKRKERIDGYHAGAIKAMNSANYDSAIDNCQSALAVDRTLAWPYVTMGEAFYHMRDYNAGISYSQRALEIEPGNRRAIQCMNNCESRLQAQYNAQVAAQRQADKWQAIANLCNSTAQLMNAIGNATNSSRRKGTTVRRQTTAAPASRPAPASSGRSSTTTTPARKSTYTGADVQNRKTTQYVYNSYNSCIMSMKAGIYPYSKGFTLSELRECQSKMRSIRTEWNAKHPDLPIYGSDLEDWSGK